MTWGVYPDILNPLHEVPYIVMESLSGSGTFLNQGVLGDLGTDFK